HRDRAIGADARVFALQPRNHHLGRPFHFVRIDHAVVVAVHPVHHRAPIQSAAAAKTAAGRPPAKTATRRPARKAAPRRSPTPAFTATATIAAATSSSVTAAAFTAAAFTAPPAAAFTATATFPAFATAILAAASGRLGRHG